MILFVFEAHVALINSAWTHFLQCHCLMLYHVDIVCFSQAACTSSASTRMGMGHMLSAPIPPTNRKCHLNDFIMCFGMP